VVVATFLVLVGASSNLCAQTLLHKGDLIYKGAFRVPAGGADSSTLSYGGRALTYNAANNSLFLAGHANYQRTAEISIPSIVNAGALSNLATAQYIQTPADATEGKLGQINPTDPNSQYIGGHLVYGGKLYLAGYSTYDGAGTQSASHFVRSLNISLKGQVSGPFLVGSDAHMTGGYMGTVPPEWQAAVGAPALTGNCCQSIISHQSFGPAVSAFDPSDLSQGNAPAIELLRYTSTNPLGPDVTSQNIYYNLTSRVDGVVFPEGTRSVLFFGKHGIGKYCYGEAAACGDPAMPYKGTHAYPYVYQVWAYDINDLLMVKAGSKRPWEILPYAVWTFNLPFESDDTHDTGGVAYDPASGRIYFSQLDGDSANRLPVIHVFQVEAVPRPVAPTALNVQ